MTLDDLVSPEYLDTLKRMHKSAIWGTKGFHYYEEIRDFIRGLPRCESVLDYGSGAETLRQRFELLDPGLKVFCYDPAIPGREHPPGAVDLVVCTDVLEHVEPDLLQNVLQHIFRTARLGVYLNIALKLAKRTLPDGRNAHLIVEPAEWWLNQITRPGWDMRHVPGRKMLKVYLTRINTA